MACEQPLGLGLAVALSCLIHAPPRSLAIPWRWERCNHACDSRMFRAYPAHGPPRHQSTQSRLAAPLPHDGRLPSMPCHGPPNHARPCDTGRRSYRSDAAPSGVPLRYWAPSPRARPVACTAPLWLRHGLARPGLATRRRLGAVRPVAVTMSASGNPTAIDTGNPSDRGSLGRRDEIKSGMFNMGHPGQVAEI